MPVLYTQQTPIMGIWETTESWQQMLESFRDKERYVSDIDRIQSDKRKQEWLAVRLLLKHLSGPEVAIGYNENGAPLLHNHPGNISISHTNGFVAVILSTRSNPGIDIEYRSERAWRLRKKYMGEAELKLFDSPYNQADNNKHPIHVDLATLCWCAKETAYKALLQTEVDFIDHLHILPFTYSEKGTLFLKETKTLQQERFQINYQMTEKYIITWKE